MSEWEKYKKSVGYLSSVSDYNFEKSQIVPGIWVYKNVFSEVEDIVSVIEECYGDVFKEASVHNNQYSKVDKSVRDCFSVGLNNHGTDFKKNQLYNLIKDRMTHCIKDYCQFYSVQFDYLLNDNWQVLKYGRGQHFNAHIDDSRKYPRTISTTAYLNDNYTGGEITYQHFDIKYKPNKGDVVVFPSNYVYKHEVVPVEEGTRYAIVNWFRWNSMKIDMDQ